MIIQIASDIHNEFGSIELNFNDTDLLILAGDIDNGERGFNWIQTQVKNLPVIYVLGNHEYYKKAYPKLAHKLKEKAAGTNIHILEKDSIELNGITFYGTTLWTNFEAFGNPKIAGMEAQYKMNDYKYIKRSPSYSKIRSIDTYNMHNESISWLHKSIEKSTTNKNVVISHHAPSMKSVPENFRKDLLSTAYASDLDAFILQTKPNVWIHGHLHNSSNYTIGKTRIINNPRGYADDQNPDFNPKLLIQL